MHVHRVIRDIHGVLNGIICLVHCVHHHRLLMSIAVFEKSNLVGSDYWRFYFNSICALGVVIKPCVYDLPQR